MKVIVNWQTIKCLSEIRQEVNVSRLMLYHANASSHAARITVEFLAPKNMKVTENPPYSPAFASDFWIF